MFKQYLEQFQTEYEKSPLLKYTMPAILVVLTLYFIDALWQASVDASDEYSQLLVRESKIHNLQQQADWGVVKEEAELRAAEMVGKIWVAESLELASADIQTELRALTKDRVVALRINMSAPERLGNSGTWQLAAEVTGKFLAIQVPDLLLDIAEEEPALSVSRFSYMPSRNQTGVLHVSAVVSLKGNVSSVEEVAQK